MGNSAAKTSFACPDNGVSLPDGTLLHDFVFQRDPVGSDRVAFVDGATGNAITHRQVRTYVKNVAAGLHSLGIRKGDTVMLILPNIPEYAAFFLGIIRAGATATTANPVYTPEEIAKQAANSSTKLVITVDELIPKTSLMTPRPTIVALGTSIPPGIIPASTLLHADGSKAPALASLSQSDTCALPYSSGTTGVAKGVMLTHRNFIANISQLQCGKNPRLPLGEDDVILAVLPMFHIYGLCLLNLAAVRAGAKVVVMARFDMELMLTLMQRERITLAPLVPPIILGLAKLPIVKKYDLSSLQRIISGAAPLDANLETSLQTRLPNCRVGQGYGMTESSPVISLSPNMALRAPVHSLAPGSAGTLVPLTEATTVDTATGKPVPAGERGELWVRGPQVMKGYLKNAEATAATLTRDGWLKTGDIGYFDRNGNLFLVDRAKELIKYKGFQVPPAELEGILLTHPSVADAAVVPEKDEEAGEVPVGFVVLRPNASVTESELLKFVADQVAPYKRLRRIRFIDAVPKSASGKILRRELKARL